MMNNENALPRENAKVQIQKARQLILLAAGLSFLLSVGLYFTNDKQNGIFVGLWVPSILSAGSLLLGGYRND